MAKLSASTVNESPLNQVELDSLQWKLSQINQELEAEGDRFLSQSELDAFVAKANEVKSFVEKKEIESYFTYVTTLDDEVAKEATQASERIMAIEAMMDLALPRPSKHIDIFGLRLRSTVDVLGYRITTPFSNKVSDSKLVNNFLKLNGKNEAKFNWVLEKQKKLVRKERSDLNERAIERVATLRARDYMRTYEKLVYQCSSKFPTAASKAAGKRFTWGSAIAAMGTSSFAYYQKFGLEMFSDEKFMVLGYDVAYEMIMTSMTAVIFSKPGLSPLAKGMLKWGMGAGAAAVTLPVYNSFFGFDDDQVRKRLEEKLGNDPEKKRILGELIARLKDKQTQDGLFEGFKDSVLNWVRLTSSVSFDIPVEIEGVDWNNLTAEDLERKDVQDVLMAAILLYSYESHASGNDIQTGSKATDWYTYNLGWSFLNIPRYIVVNMAIYNVLCLGGQNPGLAYSKAGAIFLTQRYLADLIYYSDRPERIGF